VLAALATFGVSGCGGISATLGLAQPDTPATFTPVAAGECPVQITQWPQWDCGYVTVPQSRSGNGDGDIRLAVVRLKSPSATPGAPAIQLVGGPGGNGLAGADYYAGRLAPILADRDYVFMTQRGTAGADPALTCPELTRANTSAWLAGLSEADRQAARDAALKKCVDDATAKGVNLADYTSDENAADVNDIRQAMGYGKMILDGSSYGTLLAQFVMRDYPDSVEAVVLDGVAGTTKTDWNAGLGKQTETLFNKIFAECADDPACAAAYPDPAGTMARVYDRLQAEPATVDIPADGATKPIRVNGDLAASAMFASMYSPTGPAALPRTLDLIDKGNTAPLASMVPAYLNDSAARLMHYAIACSDDPVQPPTDLAGVAAPYAGLENLEAQNYINSCAVLNVPHAPDSEDQPVTSSIPALLVSGGLDPATPEPQAEGVAQTLPNNVQILVPAGAHVQDDNPCVISIKAAFLKDPATAPDTSCLDSEPKLPAFVTDRQVTVTGPDNRSVAFTLGSDYQPQAGGTTYVTAGNQRQLVVEFLPAGTTAAQVGESWAQKLSLASLDLSSTQQVNGMTASTGQATFDLGGTPGLADVIAFERPEGTYSIAAIGLGEQQSLLTQIDVPQLLNTITITN
jgi:pimeloyl-ACP methyl ester carboxylesterase